MSACLDESRFLPEIKVACSNRHSHFFLLILSNLDFNLAQKSSSVVDMVAPNTELDTLSLTASDASDASDDWEEVTHPSTESYVYFNDFYGRQFKLPAEQCSSADVRIDIFNSNSSP